MKFYRQDYPTIGDGWVVRYTCGGFEINASRNGVSTHGTMPLVWNRDDMKIVLDIFRRAFAQYEHLSAHVSMFGRVEPLPESDLDQGDKLSGEKAENQ